MAGYPSRVAGAWSYGTDDMTAFCSGEMMNKQNSRPTRREFLQGLGMLAASSMISGISCQKNRRPALLSAISRQNNRQLALRNVLVIVGDDHAAYALGCYGNAIARTPNLDRLAGEGALFTNAFTNAPICSPSRQSVLTGKYPHAVGVTLLSTPFPADQYCLAEHFRFHGFKTAVIGKTHFNDKLAHGYEIMIASKEYASHLKEHPAQKPPESVRTRPIWKPFQDPARIWLNADGLSEPLYEKDCYGTFLADQAIRFLQENQKQRFFLWIGFTEPHSPFVFPVEYAGLFDPKDMPLPTCSPEDDRWVPQVFRDLSDDDKRGITRSYYTSVAYLDKNIGRVLQALEQYGLAEATLVIYFGDNGYLLGHHKRFEKHTMWEEATHCPLIIRLGKNIQPGKKIEALCEFIDIAPTILETTGLPAMPGLHGKTLLPLLRGESSTHKEYVLSEHLTDNLVMLRSVDYKYVFSSGKRDLGLGYATGNPPPAITHRLYDLRNDAGELHNVVNAQQYAPVLKKMQQELLAIFKRTDPRASKLPSGLSMDEALAWFCEAPEGSRAD